mgnify:CR=1 FL=1|tara:strand:- start:444 stop:1754 length:1311 start_codon:yes stop_codon:yes gene_type:complete
MAPKISEHYQNREPSAIRKAQILFIARRDRDRINAINLAIGNISLPMHPVMIDAMMSLSKKESPFSQGIVKYTPSVGSKGCQEAIFRSLDAELGKINLDGVKCVITDGGSQAMELMLLGVCGPSSTNPILFIDPTYTNYIEFCKRLSIPYVIYSRKIKKDGTFTGINMNEISEIIDGSNPSGIVIIPGDNPTGQQISQNEIFKIAKICIEKELWLISDEAYRNLYFTESGPSSIWLINNREIPGISGRRISIESASKIWNACGLRIGSLVTDNDLFHEKVVSEYTANLCANSIGQYIFSSILKLSKNEIRLWFEHQRIYYHNLMVELRTNLLEKIPNLIVSKPESALYIVIDFKMIFNEKFDVENFIEYCAKIGKTRMNNEYYTILLAPMTGFYYNKADGKTQARIAIVESENKIKIVPDILSSLIKDYSNYIGVN